MAFLDRFRKAKEDVSAVSSQKVNVETSVPKSKLVIEEFLPVNQEEKELVTLIASSILAGDRQNSEYHVKKIYRRNDERAVVAAIASSILAGDSPESTFQIRTIERIK